MTAGRLDELRRQVPRGRDYHEAERGRVMSDVRPPRISPADAANVLRYAALDSLASTLPDVDAARLKHAVTILMLDLYGHKYNWLFGAESPAGQLAHGEQFPELPPLLTVAEMEARAKGIPET